ncbi:hypothetical protein CM1200mP19_1800 [bacterium]|nr:MAG: hypothetical protein CM1200mP19_1800 [bacterium]
MALVSTTVRSPQRRWSSTWATSMGATCRAGLLDEPSVHATFRPGTWPPSRSRVAEMSPVRTSTDLRALERRAKASLGPSGGAASNLTRREARRVAASSRTVRTFAKIRWDQPITYVGGQSVVDPPGEVGHVGHRGGVRKDGAGAIDECLEPSGPEFESKGPCHDVLGLVGLVEDSQVMLGQDRPLGSQVDPVEMEVGDNNVRHCCRRPRIFRKAVVAAWAPCCTGALI